jgi:hypothetical protein
MLVHFRTTSFGACSPESRCGGKLNELLYVSSSSHSESEIESRCSSANVRTAGRAAILGLAVCWRARGIPLPWPGRRGTRFHCVARLTTVLFLTKNLEGLSKAGEAEQHSQSTKESPARRCAPRCARQAPFQNVICSQRCTVRVCTTCVACKWIRKTAVCSARARK